MEKCQYSNLCFTDGKWKINIVSDGLVWMAEMKRCSDSPMCLNFQTEETLAHLKQETARKPSLKNVGWSFLGPFHKEEQ